MRKVDIVPLVFWFICAQGFLFTVSNCNPANTKNPNLDGTYRASQPAPEVQSIDLSLFGSNFRQVWNVPPVTMELSGSFGQKKDSLCFYLAKCIVVPDMDCPSDMFSLNENPCSLFTFNNNTIRFLDPSLGWIVFRER